MIGWAYFRLFDCPPPAAPVRFAVAAVPFWAPAADVLFRAPVVFRPGAVPAPAAFRTDAVVVFRATAVLFRAAAVVFRAGAFVAVADAFFAGAFFAVAFFAVAFFAGARLVVAFFAGAFFAVAFFAGARLVVAFFAGAFFAVARFAGADTVFRAPVRVLAAETALRPVVRLLAAETAFFVVAFFAGAFLAVVFFAGAFLAGAFFAVVFLAAVPPRPSARNVRTRLFTRSIFRSAEIPETPRFRSCPRMSSTFIMLILFSLMSAVLLVRRFDAVAVAPRPELFR
ncbi:hypothetical protein [Plantactinospora sp. B5E13]|uniref:hypothetical protein n=1 Tax=Plantactinospora sp. B5E13 TaxID=3153758 RepID=UPI00325C60EA